MSDSTDNMTKPENSSRREFLSKAAVAGTVTIAPGVFLHSTANASSGNLSTRELDDPITSKQRWGMLIDTAKCASDCTACVDACNDEHGLTGSHEHSDSSQITQYIRKVTLRDKATGHESSLPMLCQHCETAPCVDVCPTGASFVREDGIALVDKHICIGCRYCMMACPYKARSFVHEDLKNQTLTAPRGKGTVESCTMCVTRVDNGNIPACVEACTKDNHNAMIFGDLNNPDSDLSKELKRRGGKQLRPDLALNTGVRYQGL